MTGNMSLSQTANLPYFHPVFIACSQLLCSGEVLRYQFKPPWCHWINNCEATSTFEGGINSVLVTLVRGAVLPAVVQMVADYRKWWKEPSKGVTNSPLNDKYSLENHMITKEGRFYTVDSMMMNTLKDAYPQINVEQEIKKMEAWCLCNPAKRKTFRCMPRFINSWLKGARPEPNPSFQSTRERRLEDDLTDTSWAYN